MKNLSVKKLKKFLVPGVAFIIGVGISLVIAPDLPFFADTEETQDKCTYRTVTHVVDGDTFDLENGSRVRMIGIDAPELNTEFYAKEARLALMRMIEGNRVCLKMSDNDTVDKYNRLLRYVYDGGTFVNSQMVETGSARTYTRFPFEYKSTFLSLETIAQEENKGMWNIQAKQAYQELSRRTSDTVSCGTSVICGKDAINHIGETATVRFYVEASYNSGKVVFLNSMDDQKHPHNFTAVIYASNFSKFPKNPAFFYKNKIVDVTGQIIKYKRRAEIILGDQSQIQIVHP